MSLFRALKALDVLRFAYSLLLGRVMIVFAGICKGKNQNCNVLRASKKFHSLFFVAHKARYDFEFSLANASQINRNAPKARYECAALL